MIQHFQSSENCDCRENQPPTSLCTVAIIGSTLSRVTNDDTVGQSLTQSLGTLISFGLTFNCCALYDVLYECCTLICDDWFGLIGFVFSSSSDAKISEIFQEQQK